MGGGVRVVVIGNIELSNEAGVSLNMCQTCDPPEAFSATVMLINGRPIRSPNHQADTGYLDERRPGDLGVPLD